MRKWRVVHLVVWSMAMMGAGADQPSGKPACDASTLGSLYPAQANSDRQIRNELFTCGELQVCARGRWKYRWVPLSVRIDQLVRNGSAHRPQRCVVLMQDIDRLQTADPTIAATGENE